MDLAGKKVVLTGTFTGMSRSEAKKALEAQGAVVRTAISKATDLVFAGARAGKKLAQAEALGIPVYDEATLQTEIAASPTTAPELAFTPIAPPSWLTDKSAAEALGCGASSIFVPTTRGAMGVRKVGDAPWWQAPKEVFIDLDGDLAVFSHPTSGRRLGRVLSAAPSGTRALVLVKMVGVPELVEHVHGESPPETILPDGALEVSPDRQVKGGGYLDSDDYIAVWACACLPKNTDGLELWRRTSRGFVRVDDIRSAGVHLLTARRIAVLKQDNHLCVFGRVGERLVGLGRARIPSDAPYVFVGPEGEIVARNEERTVAYALQNTDVALDAQQPPAVRPNTAQLAELDSSEVLPIPFEDVPDGWSSARCADEHYWALFDDSLVIATDEETTFLELPAEVRDWGEWSVSEDGRRALFETHPGGIREFELDSQTWREHRESGRPFYLRVDEVDLVGVATDDETSIYDRRQDGSLGTLLARIPLCTSACGRRSLIGTDHRLYTLEREGERVRIVKGPTLVPPGRRLKRLPVSGVIKDGVGYAFVQTSPEGHGSFCWIDEGEDVVPFA